MRSPFGSLLDAFGDPLWGLRVLLGGSLGLFEGLVWAFWGVWFGLQVGARALCLCFVSSNLPCTKGYSPGAISGGLLAVALPDSRQPFHALHANKYGLESHSSRSLFALLACLLALCSCGTTIRPFLRQPTGRHQHMKAHCRENENCAGEGGPAVGRGERLL